MPWPIGTLPIVEPDHSLERQHEPGALAGEVDAGRLAEAELVGSSSSSRVAPSFSASVIAPTLDEYLRICATLNVSVPRFSASWMTRSATWIEYGSVNFVSGVTRPSERTPVTVTSLKVEPGS